MEERLSEKSKVLERLEERRIGENAASADPPKVSVIIPAYNISEFITATLDSVFAQTYTDFEVVVVNDGSEDTPELEKNLEKYSDRIIYGRQKNSGASRARNAAICLSRGELIAFLDGDDLWFPGYLKKQVEFLETGGFDMVYCDAELFGENFPDGKTYMETTPSAGEVNFVSLLNATCNVITSGTVLRRQKLAEVNLFDTKAKRAQDFELWLRLAKSGAKIGYQRDVLIKYRVSSESLSGSNVQRAERNITILHFIKNKYRLTGKEQKVLEDQIAFSCAELELEKGKTCLAEQKYDEARIHIARANEYYGKLKLSVLKTLLKISPGLTLRLFKRLRPEEFSFISPVKK